MFVLLKAPISLLRDYADSIGFQMLLDSEGLQQIIEKGDQNCNIKGVVINGDKFYCKYDPYSHIFGPYRNVSDNSNTEDIYWRPRGSLDKTPFRTIVRLKLIAMLLERVPPGR